MRTRIASFLAVVLVGSICAHADPDLAQKPEKLILWSAGDQGYELFRIPGIVVSKRGTILAYTNARRTIAQGDWGDSDIMLRRSADGGKTYQRSQHIAGDGHGVTDNPVAIAAQTDGKIHFLYQHDYARVFYMVSSDEGQTFSPAVDITGALEDLRSDFPWTVVALGPGHAIQMTTGRLLVPVWLAAGKVHPDGTRAHAPSAITTLYSDDNGKTWHHGDLIARATPELINPNENQDIQLSDGSIMANIRTGDSRDRRLVAFSPDGIHAWTRPTYDEHLYDPICDAGIVRYSAKPKDAENIILFTNPDSEDTPAPGGGTKGLRRNITVRVSTDEGKTWPVKRVLEPGVAGYSDIAVGRDKTIFDIYETPLGTNNKEHSVVITRFKLEWVTHGQAIPSGSH